MLWASVDLTRECSCLTTGRVRICKVKVDGLCIRRAYTGVRWEKVHVGVPWRVPCENTILTPVVWNQGEQWLSLLFILTGGPRLAPHLVVSVL